MCEKGRHVCVRKELALAEDRLRLRRTSGGCAFLEGACEWREGILGGGL